MTLSATYRFASEAVVDGRRRMRRIFCDSFFGGGSGWEAGKQEHPQKLWIKWTYPQCTYVLRVWVSFERNRKGEVVYFHSYFEQDMGMTLLLKLPVRGWETRRAFSWIFTVGHRRSSRVWAFIRISGPWLLLWVIAEWNNWRHSGGNHFLMYLRRHSERTVRESTGSYYSFLLLWMVAGSKCTNVESVLNENWKPVSRVLNNSLAF